ncbi:MAG: hypothetical protein AAGC96_22080, partial [Pseudomonadota bacterium]
MTRSDGMNARSSSIASGPVMIPEIANTVMQLLQYQTKGAPTDMRTAFGADPRALRSAGLVSAASVVIGVVASFIVGALVAVAFGYRDAVSVSTIGAGAATYIVGPVTGTALGADSEVVALSVAAGLTKS